MCVIRDLQRNIAAYETRMVEKYGLCLNEGMLLCTLSNAKRPLSSGEIAEMLGLTTSNASKVIASVERKGLIERSLGNADKRHMYFKLTGAGHGKLRAVTYGTVDLPDQLRAIVQAAS